MSRGSIIIAAHNEESVIARTLNALKDIEQVSVLVICNGCSDRTAAIAREYPGVEVAELDVASKVAALREGDRRAGAGPRIYLDADVVLTSRAASAVIRDLAAGALAGRPPHTFDSRRATWVVRRWYYVRERLPSISSALWGAGCYGLSEEARARFTEFPDVVSDDLFIDSLFTNDEVVIVETDPVVVTTPRRVSDLLRILRRSYRTQSEVEVDAPGFSQGQRGQVSDLAALVRRQPARVLDVAVYLAVIAYARLRARTSRANERWERDTSSRSIG